MPCCSIGGFIPVVHPGAFVYPAAACCVGPNASLRGDFGRIVMLFGANVQDKLRHARLSGTGKGWSEETDAQAAGLCCAVVPCAWMRWGRSE